MNAESERHLRSILRQATRRINAKYRQGNREHGGGNLTAKKAAQLMEDLLDECIDLIVYGLTLKEKLAKR